MRWSCANSEDERESCAGPSRKTSLRIGSGRGTRTRDERRRGAEARCGLVAGRGTKSRAVCIHPYRVPLRHTTICDRIVTDVKPSLWVCTPVVEEACPADAPLGKGRNATKCPPREVRRREMWGSMLGQRGRGLRRQLFASNRVCVSDEAWGCSGSPA